VFAYNQPCTYTLAAIVQRLTGLTLTDYLGPRLFAPLGITDGAWQQRPPGRDLGFSGLHLTTEDVASFGQLLLDDGAWAGRQVLPEGWVAQATREPDPTLASARAAAVTGSGADWEQGYGLQFWQSRHGFRGDGAYGQFCVVLPEHDVVLATTGACPDMQAVLDAAWTHLIPALADPTTAPSPAEGRLAARLSTLGLPPVPVGHAPEAGSRWKGATLRLAEATGLRGILDIVLHDRGSQDGGGWALSVQAWDGSVTAAVGIGAWAVTDPDDGTAPVAVCAGWPDADRAVIDLVLLETPHRLRLTGDLTSATLRPAWHTEPLGGVSLRSMQQPLGRPADHASV
jgi:hypothetical protein